MVNLINSSEYDWQTNQDTVLVNTDRTKKVLYDMQSTLAACAVDYSMKV